MTFPAPAGMQPEPALTSPPRRAYAQRGTNILRLVSREPETKKREAEREKKEVPIEAVPQPPFVVIPRPGPQPLPSVIVVWYG